jgi:hypothetical protein
MVSSEDTDYGNRHADTNFKPRFLFIAMIWINAGARVRFRNNGHDG